MINKLKTDRLVQALVSFVVALVVWVAAHVFGVTDIPQFDAVEPAQAAAPEAAAEPGPVQHMPDASVPAKEATTGEPAAK